MKTLDVKTCNDWELVLAVNSPSSVTGPARERPHRSAPGDVEAPGRLRSARAARRLKAGTFRASGTARRGRIAAWRGPSGGCWISTASRP